MKARFSMEELKNKIHNYVLQLLSTFKGEFIDCCYTVCKWCEENEYNLEEQSYCVELVCDNYGIIRSSEENILKCYISKEEKEELIREYGKFVDEILNVTLHKAYHNGYLNGEFYQTLWIGLCNCGIISSLKERVFALYYVAIDRKVPYFYLKKGVLMNNEEYQKCLLENNASMRKIQFILSSNFSQKTEEASLIIDELINAKSYEDQIILMTCILNTMRNDEKKLRRLLQQLKDEVN